MPQSYTKKKGQKQFMPDPDKYLFNIDTIYYTVEIRNYNKVMDEWLREVLSIGRDVYYDSEEGSPLNTLSLKIHGYDKEVDFEIMGGQKNTGPFSIRNEDYALYFKKSDNTPNTFPVKVQINQSKLWSLGYMAAFEESLQILIALGFDFNQCKPNRIDPCVHSDQWQWSLDDFKKFDYPRDVKKTNFPNFIHLDVHTGSFETFYQGSRTSGCLLRIYNKSLQATKKGKSFFLDLYKEKGLDPDKVWNIEFELNRKFLKDFVNPDTAENNFFDDMENLLSPRGLSFLWSFLMKKFTHPSAHWSLIEKGDISKFSYIEEKLVRHKEIDNTIEREILQIVGRLKKVVVKEETENGKEMDRAIEILKEKYKEIEEASQKTFSEDLNRKRKLYMDRKINSLSYRKESAQLTGYVQEVAYCNNELYFTKMERSILNLKRKKERYFRLGDIASVARVDKEIDVLKDLLEKEKALVAVASTQGHV